VNHLIEPPTFGIDWCHKLGACPDTLEPLQGGINNQVFRCMAGGRRFVLKGYAAHRTGEYDRFKAEVEFLNYARMVAPGFVPQLLGSDDANRSLVVESLEGKGFQEGTHPSEDDIDCAVNFLRRLNGDLELAKQHVNGSAADGFLRLTEHLRNIEQRASKMRVKHLPANFRAKADGLIKCVRRELDYLQERTAQLITKGNCEDALDPINRCVSPSDFGFHNAIRTHQGIKFFDFEFAGWDDPVKAVADFDLQPRVPLTSRARALSTALPQWSKGLKERYDVLFPIFKLKWACIILAVLNPDRYAQITALDDGQTSEQLVRGKLDLAPSYLAKD
jgi:hypothetical protein